MKATLEFDLSDPSESEEFRIVNLAKDMHSALFHIEQEIRKIKKYGASNSELSRAIDSWQTLASDLINH
jgi:hypothetical protein